MGVQNHSGGTPMTSVSQDENQKQEKAAEQEQNSQQDTSSEQKAMPVNVEDLFITIFFIVDNWFMANEEKHKMVGRKASFSNSEVATLVLMMDFLPFPSERQFLAFIRANYLYLFPDLLSQGQFNVRIRLIRRHIDALRRSWTKELIKETQQFLLLDTKPVPVLSYKRNKDSSDFLGSANYGYCSSKAMKYFGYKLVVLTSLSGVPLHIELVPANIDEREAAEEVLQFVKGCEIIGDKGFIGEEWQVEMFGEGNRVWTSKKKSQKTQNPKEFDKLINSLRQRIEGVFNELQNLGKNVEKLFAKTVVGLVTRVMAAITSHICKLYLRRFYTIDVQAFSTIPA